MSPRVRRAGTECLHDLSLRMITPNRPAQRDALLRGSARHPHLTRAGSAAAAIKPAVWSEPQAVGKGVMHVRRASQAIENHFGRAVRHVIPITVRNETKLRRTHHPNPTVSDLNAREHL